MAPEEGDAREQEDLGGRAGGRGSPSPGSLSAAEAEARLPQASQAPAPDAAPAAGRRRSRSRGAASPSPQARRKLKKDAFGRTPALGNRYADGSASPGSESRSESESSRSRRGKGLPMGFMPGVFNPLMMMGARGMFPGFGGGMDGAGMFAPMWSWPGMQGTDHGRDDSEKGKGKGKRRFSRSRSRDDDPNKVTDTLAISKSIMGRVIGKAGSIINKIREASGARIDAEDRSDDKCDFRIRGKPEEVAKAKAMIQEVADKAVAERAAGAPGPGGRVDEIEGPCESMDFPIAVMGGIIGAKGSKIMDVRTRSGAKVNVDKSDDGKRCVVKIAGTEEQIEKAKALVKENVEQDPGNPDGGGEGGEAIRQDTFEFPSSVTGRIIGSKGAAIAEVRSQSGARISVEKGDEKCKVHISGSEEQIQAAHRLVTALAEDTSYPAGGHRRPRDEDKIDIPMAAVGRIIGKGGETVTRLQRETGARIDIDTKCGDPCPVRFTGSRECVARAKRMVQEIMDRYHNGQPSQNLQGGDHAAWNTAWNAGPPGYPGYGSPPPGYGSWGPPPAGDGTWRQAQWPMAALPGSSSVGGDKAPAPALSQKADIDLDEL